MTALLSTPFPHRVIIAVIFCFIFQAVGCLPSRRRPTSTEETPFFTFMMGGWPQTKSPTATWLSGRSCPSSAKSASRSGCTDRSAGVTGRGTRDDRKTDGLLATTWMLHRNGLGTAYEIYRNRPLRRLPQHFGEEPVPVSISPVCIVLAVFEKRSHDHFPTSQRSSPLLQIARGDPIAHERSSVEAIARDIRSTVDSSSGKSVSTTLQTAARSVPR